MSSPSSDGKKKTKALSLPLPPFLQRWFRSDASSVGLDLGARSVKAVQLKKAGTAFTLIRHGIEELPPQADAASRTQAIRALLQPTGKEKKRVAAAVGGPGTVLRTVAVPKMSPEELKAALHFEAEKYIPFKLEEVYLDSAILKEQPGGRMEVVLGAARRDLVKGRLELLASAGAAPSVMNLEGVALANAWEVSPGRPPSGGNAEAPACLLHLGARGSLLLFLAGMELHFTREIPLGGDAFTQAIAQGLSVDPIEAERIKCAPSDRLGDVRAALQPSWEEWLTQCRASFDFYENQFGRGVGGLFLSGGSARLAGFKEWLQESTGIPAEIWNPTGGLQVPAEKAVPESEAARLGVAVGLALGGLV